MAKDDTNKKSEELNTKETEKTDGKKEKRIEECEEKAQEFEDKYKRALADYQNLTKRTQEERIEWIQTANRELILKMLPILDTLLLASSHSQDKNIQVIIQQFLGILKEEGVTRIETIGKEFNPHLMEAIGTKEEEEGKVIEEARAGFRIAEKVLRPAQVIVGQSSKY